MQRVSDDEAAVFAKYREDDELVWYRADPSLLKLRDGDDTREKERDEFVWLRDLALDLRDARAALAEAEAVAFDKRDAQYANAMSLPQACATPKDASGLRNAMTACEADYAEAVKVVYSMFHNPGVPNAAATVVLSTDHARRVLEVKPCGS